MGARSERSAVKLPSEILDEARRLSAVASRHGWAALGIDRQDPATITAIFEAAIALLTDRAAGDAAGLAVAAAHLAARGQARANAAATTPRQRRTRP